MPSVDDFESLEPDHVPSTAAGQRDGLDWTVYIYPQRHPRYQALTTRYPPSKTSSQILLVAGWPHARDVMNAYFRNDHAWIHAWRTYQPLPNPHTNGREPLREPPIPDLNLDPAYERYRISLRPTHAVHQGILRYVHESLPAQKARMLFFRVLLVCGAENPIIDEKVLGGL